MRPTRPRTLLAAAVALLVAGCSGPSPSDPTNPPAPGAPSSSTAPTSVPTSATPSEPVEPSTTNTLPPPPHPSTPAPSTAGPLSAASLPVPSGWRTVEPPGNDEIGQPGNGTWVQSLDPRYAAQGAVSVGCASVTRDDYPDPVAALEGGYRSRSGDPGVGLALEFATVDDAAAFWAVYVRGVRACEGGSDGIRTFQVREPPVPGGRGLVDRRTDETQDPTGWTEVGALGGKRVVLITLGDPRHRISETAADALLARLAR